jgi:hypothetical protein
MKQMVRNATMEGCGALRHCRYLLHDRDTKYSPALRATIETGHVKIAHAERWAQLRTASSSACPRSLGQFMTPPKPSSFGVRPWPLGTAALAAATILRETYGERVGGNNEPQRIIDQVVAFV